MISALDVLLCPLILQTWPLFEKKMKSAHLSSAAIDAFKHNYSQLVAGVTGLVRGTWVSWAVFLSGVLTLVWIPLSGVGC